MSDVAGFVFIVESPAPVDLLDGRTEGAVLGHALRIAEIPHWYSLAVDRRSLQQAFSDRLMQAWQANDKRLPIVHLSMHGDSEGVFLTSGEHLSWNDLRSLLSPLLRAMDGGLLVCMSSCFGSAGCRMAMHVDDEPPFWALVGNTGKPTWADAAVAYVSFYHLFFKSLPLSVCVESMKVASGDHNFVVHNGAETKAGWKIVADRISARAEAAIRQAAAENQPED